MSFRRLKSQAALNGKVVEIDAELKYGTENYTFERELRHVEMSQPGRNLIGQCANDYAAMEHLNIPYASFSRYYVDLGYWYDLGKDGVPKVVFRYSHNQFNWITKFHDKMTIEQIKALGQEKGLVRIWPREKRTLAPWKGGVRVCHTHEWYGEGIMGRLRAAGHII